MSDGIEKRINNLGCEECTCNDPCYGVFCEEGEECAIELISNDDYSPDEVHAVCRQSKL